MVAGRLNTYQEFPSFEVLLPDLNQFILDLVEDYNAKKIKSWGDLEVKVNTFFTPEMMDQTEAIIPHWRKMASYADGLTLIHVMCVFMGLYMLPEFMGMPEHRQQLMKWTILLHDVEKELRDGKRDHPHAFRSAVGAAHTLPKLGFPTTPEYDLLIDEWDEFTRSAVTLPENSSDNIPDNCKLPQILDGIERMFGHNTPATLIIKTVLLHLSVNMTFWPPAAPLTNEEMKRYFDKKLIPLLRVMHLADGEGWLLFDPENREPGRMDTLAVFERVERLISEPFQIGENRPIIVYNPVKSTKREHPTMNEELTALIITELGKHHSRDAIIMAVCEKGGLNWKQAEQLIEEVEGQHKRAIATRQSPLLILISAVTIIAGMGLVAYGVLFFADFFQRDLLERALLLRTGYYKIVSLVTGLGMFGGGSYGFWKAILPLLKEE